VRTRKFATSVRFTLGDSLCQLGVRGIVKPGARELRVRLRQFIRKVRHSSLDNVQAVNTKRTRLYKIEFTGQLSFNILSDARTLRFQLRALE
jgi:hypothetical protein